MGLTDEEKKKHPYFIMKRIKEARGKGWGKEYKNLGMHVTNAMADLIEWQIRKSMELHKEKQATKRGIISMTMELFDHDVEELEKTLPDIIVKILETFKGASS